MDKITLAIIANILFFTSGVLFGMGVARKLFQRENRNIQPNNSNDSAIKPLPVTKIKPDDGSCNIS